MFDSSVMRGRPATFGLNQVIAGWTEGLQLMSVGDKVRFWIPEDLAYQGKAGAPAGLLVFDVELLEIQKVLYQLPLLLPLLQMRKPQPLDWHTKSLPKEQVLQLLMIV